MSTSSRRNVSGAPPPPYPHNLTDRDRDRIGIGAAGAYPMYPSPPDYTARPSVITCASSLRSSPAPSCPSPCSSTGSVSSSSAALRAASPVHHHQQQQQQRGRSDPADRIPQRREIISSGQLILQDFEIFIFYCKEFENIQEFSGLLTLPVPS